MATFVVCDLSLLWVIGTVLVYLIHVAWGGNIWWPVSAWPSSCGTPSVISLMLAALWAWNFWTPSAQCFINWLETWFLWLWDSGLYFLLIPHLPEVTWCLQFLWPNPSGAPPKARALFPPLYTFSEVTVLTCSSLEKAKVFQVRETDSCLPCFLVLCFSFSYLLFYMCECFVWMCLCAPCAHSSQKWVVDYLDWIYR